jgi:Zn-dependent protease
MFFFIQLLATDPLAYLVALAALAFSLVLHNIAQASLASAFGDGTARLRGFTSTEPRLHLDTFYLIWLAVFGFAIPTQIPLNSYAFSKQGPREALVWWSGPLAMIVWAFVLVTTAVLMSRFGGVALEGVANGLSQGAIRVLSLGVVFLFPVPPLPGARAVFAIGSQQVRGWLRDLEGWMARSPFSFMLIFVVLSILGVTGALSNLFLSIFLAILSAVGLA